MYYRLKQFILLLGDLLTLYVGLFAAVSLRYWQIAGGAFIDLLPYMFWLFLAALVIMFIVGMYDLGRSKNTWNFYRKIIISALVWMGIAVLYFYLTPRANLTPKIILVLTAICGFGLLAAWRAFHNAFLSTTIWRTNVAFVGYSKEAAELVELFSKEPERGYRCLGVVDGQTANVASNITIVSSIHELITKTNLEPEIIVFGPTHQNDAAILKELYEAIFKQTSVVSLADFYEDNLKRIPPFTFSEAWFITNLKEQHKKINDRFRILVDFIAAIIMGMFFLITFPFLALLIKLTSKGAMFFKQTRVGRGGKTFTMFKYRTMQSLSIDGSAETHGAEYATLNDPRITKLGKFLRRTRLDEIPQFLNILKGEMAIIGPRPERPEFVAKLTAEMPFYALRHLIKPGLTGWAQIHESYYGTIKENLYKLEYDLYYVKNRGPILDLAITLRTVNILLRMIGR